MIYGESMAQTVSMQEIYKELKHLRRDVNEMRLAIIPTENISEKERKEIRKILKEMDSGQRTNFRDIKR